MQSSCQTVHNLIILDESGSMDTIRQETVSGFNELVQTIRYAQEKFPEQQHFITLVTFNGLGIRTPILRQPVAMLEPLDHRKYQPNSVTPLFDAMGLSCLEMDLAIGERSDAWCLVSILTDGYENASREFSANAIRAMVERLGQRNWTFTYIGANHDVGRTAASLSIDNHMHWTSDKEGSAGMWARERQYRMAFTGKMSKGVTPEALKRQYYGDTDNTGDNKGEGGPSRDNPPG